MPIGNHDRLTNRLREIRKLEAEMERIRSRLLELTGLAESDHTEDHATVKIMDYHPLQGSFTRLIQPRQIQYNAEFPSIFSENKRKLSSNDVRSILENKHQTTIDRKTVQSALDYAVKRGLLRKEGSGKGKVFYNLK